MEGANASAEEADEGTDAASESGVDVILNHRLVETGFGSKKDYTVYLKDYMKKVIAYLEENDMKDQVEGFKKNIQAVMGDLLKKFKDLQFFTGNVLNTDYFYDGSQGNCFEPWPLFSKKYAQTDGYLFW